MSGKATREGCRDTQIQSAEDFHIRFSHKSTVSPLIYYLYTMKKIFDIELTLEELKIIDIALASSHLRHDISYDSMRSRRIDLTERWKTAEELRDKIAQIIDINTL